MKWLGLVALTAALLGATAPQAWANPGNGWVLVGNETVRYFLPGNTPPDGATLASGNQATALSSGATFASNEWLLVSTQQVKYFLPDPGTEGAQKVDSKYVSSRNEAEKYYLGRTGKVFGTETRDDPWAEPDTSKWSVHDRNQFAVRYSVPVYQLVHKPWSIFDTYGWKTRSVVTNQVTYRIDKPVRTSSGELIVDTRTFTRLEDSPTPWAYGQVDASLNERVSSGIDDEVAALEPKLHVSSLVAADIKDLSGSGKAKSATFLSDNSVGTAKTALAGSKKRVVFKADNAVASKPKPAGNSDAGSVSSPLVGKDNDEGNGDQEGSGVSASSFSASGVSASSYSASGVGSIGAAGLGAVADSLPNVLTAADWVGTFQQGSKRVVVELSGTNHLRFKLYSKNGQNWTSVGNGGTQGSFGADFQSYSDPNGNFRGSVQLNRQGGTLHIKGELEGDAISTGNGRFTFNGGQGLAKQ